MPPQDAQSSSKSIPNNPRNNGSTRGTSLQPAPPPQPSSNNPRNNVSIDDEDVLNNDDDISHLKFFDDPPPPNSSVTAPKIIPKPPSSSKFTVTDTRKGSRSPENSKPLEPHATSTHQEFKDRISR